MDFATFNGLYTLFLIIIFVALILWAYSKRQKQSFDDIANSIFEAPKVRNENEFDDKKQSGVKKS